MLGGEFKEENISQLSHAQALSSPGGSNVDSVIRLDAETGDGTQGISDNIVESSGDASSLDYGPHIVEALKCLKHCETSLSPGVYDLVVNSMNQLALTEHLVLISESTFLLKDCTLDWDIISLHLNSGNQELLL